MSELKPIFENWNVEIKRSLEPYDSIVFMSENVHGTSEITDVELNTIERAIQFMTLFLIDNGRPDLKAELVDEFNLRISRAEPYLKDQNVLHKADIRQIFREAINTIMGDTE